MNRPNFVLITADDMNWDAVGAFGCQTAGTTPNIDRLAAEGLRFRYGHVTIAVCQPSRSALMTGRYPHLSGGEGFYRLRYEGVPILPTILRDVGYDVGILGKVPHSTPYQAFQWDMGRDQSRLGQGRNPEVYYQYAKNFVQDAVDGGRPFFLMANSHDPHRPFYGNDKPEWYGELDPPAVPPSRTFEPEEVIVPGFLPDIPDVRLEIAEYYNSVRRCDDTVGRLLDALDEVGVAENTLVMFLSDNGMAFPFAKTNCYLNSTRTPWVVRWPAVIQAGHVDAKHFISGIDYLPTVLDAIGVDIPNGVNGQSLLPVLRGTEQAGCEQVFTQFHQTSARRNYPMRCVQNARFGYIFNPWSDGVRAFRNESQNSRSWQAMEEAAASDSELAARNHLFTYRVLEEFYDFANDPNALNNLIDDPNYAGEIQDLRNALEEWMVETDDPALEAFRGRASRQALDNLMDHLAGTIGQRADE
ncbi:MAG: sulfatase [Gemmatimonadetes bacterium]|nr:sulfatase [Gemmatimonadota bacterium]MYI63198.1 sulfatase [Gemmatimonadota bacterium]